MNGKSAVLEFSSFLTNNQFRNFGQVRITFLSSHLKVTFYIRDLKRVREGGEKKLCCGKVMGLLRGLKARLDTQNGSGTELPEFSEGKRRIVDSSEKRWNYTFGLSGRN